MLELGFRLRAATPGWCVGVCVCLRARSSCTPPLLAGVCGVRVCVWARVSAAPRHSWVGCRGVCAPVCALRLYPAKPGWGLWSVGLMLPGTCSCAMVRCVLCALPGFAAPGGCRCLASVRVPWFWLAACLSGVPRGPAWCAAPRPVRLLSVLRSAFLTPWYLSPPRRLVPPALLSGPAGHAEAGREPGSLCLPLAPAEAGALGSLCVVPIWRPAMGLSLAGPSGVGLGLRALRWLACVDPVTDASGFPYRPSSGRGTRPVHRGCFVWTPTPSLSGQRTPRPGAARVCVCVPCLAGSGGPASRARCGAPHLFLWPVLVHSLFARSPPGWGCSFFLLCASVVPGVPCLRALAELGLGVLLPHPFPPFFLFLFFFPTPPLPPFYVFAVCAPVVSGFPCFPARVPWPLASPCTPLPPLIRFFFIAIFLVFVLPAFPWAFVFFSSPVSFCFFFPPLCAPVVSGVPCVPARGALGRGVSLSLPRPPPFFSFLPVCFFFLSVPCRWCGAGLVGASWAVGCAGVCFGGAVAVVALCAVLSRPSGAGWCCVVLPVVFGCLLLGLAILCCLLAGLVGVFRWCCPCLAAWLAVLWFGVVCLGAPLPCVVFCGAVLFCGGVLLCSAVCLCRCLCLLFVSCRCGLLCVLLGVVMCVPCPLRPVPCCAALCWCPCVVLSAWSALFLVPGAVGS